MSRWFRMYDDLLDDPKVQRLDPVLFKTWVNLLCLASRNDGKLPAIDDIAFALRVSGDVASSRLNELFDKGLLDTDEADNYAPHNWNKRQYKSDNSTERSRKHRGLKSTTSTQQECNVAPTVAATPPDTDTDTDTDTDRLDDVGCAREDVSRETIPPPTDDMAGVERLLRQAAGWEREPHPNLFVLGPVMAALDNGVDLNLDLIPAARAYGPQITSRSSWDYILKAAVTAKNKRLGAASDAARPISVRPGKTHHAKPSTADFVSEFINS